MNNNELIKNLARLRVADTIINKFEKEYINIEEKMLRFLKSSISEENKDKVLELLYLFQLYSNAYLGPDPKVVSKRKMQAEFILNSINDDELSKRIEELEETVRLMKEAETHPIESLKRKFEDQEKYNDVIF